LRFHILHFPLINGGTHRAYVFINLIYPWLVWIFEAIAGFSDHNMVEK